MKSSSTPRRDPAGAVFLLICAISLCGCGRGLLDDYGDEMVYYGYTPRIQGLDPVRAGDVASSRCIALMYEGLLQYAYLERPYRVEPALAEALPEVSEDGLTYTFRIRKGVHFQDDPCFEVTDGKGREVVAEDFVYSIKRVADIKSKSSGYWAFNGRIVGLDAFRETSAGSEPTDYDAPVEGLQALDDHTLQIMLAEPYPQLLWILAMHYAFAVPREAVEYYDKDAFPDRDDFVNHPVGTGPYVLHSWRRNYKIAFVRNPKWEEEGRVERFPTKGEPEDEALGLLVDAGKPIPFIDRIIWNVIDDANTHWLMFLTGQLGTSGISQDNWESVVTDARDLNDELTEKEITLRTSPQLTIGYIGFNMDDPVVGGDNKELRQALSCAINTEEWVKFNNGRITRPPGPIPPGVAGYQDRPPDFDFDLERARRLLAEAGYPDGIDPKTGKRLELTLELRSATSAEVRQRADLMAAFVDKIGVRLTPSYNNWPTFLDKMDRRQAQMFWLGWVADYPDAENFLQLFYGKNSSPGPNHANFENAEFDALYEKARVMQDSPERTLLYQQMSDIVVEEAPWIFTSTPVSYSLTHQWIKNLKSHDFPYGMPRYFRIDMDVMSDWKDRFGHR